MDTGNGQWAGMDTNLGQGQIPGQGQSPGRDKPRGRDPPLGPCEAGLWAGSPRQGHRPVPLPQPVGAGADSTQWEVGMDVSVPAMGTLHCPTPTAGPAVTALGPHKSQILFRPEAFFPTLIFCTTGVKPRGAPGRN